MQFQALSSVVIIVGDSESGQVAPECEGSCNRPGLSVKLDRVGNASCLGSYMSALEVSCGLEHAC